MLILTYYNQQKWNHWWNAREFYSLLVGKVFVRHSLADIFLIATLCGQWSALIQRNMEKKNHHVFIKYG